MKECMLGVRHETLTNFGAVSEQTVREMITGALKTCQADYAIAVSGIAGPDGGTPDKPVGTIWVAVGNKDRTVPLLLSTGHGHRDINMEMSANLAFNQLRKLLLGII